MREISAVPILNSGSLKDLFNYTFAVESISYGLKIDAKLTSFTPDFNVMREKFSKTFLHRRFSLGMLASK
jgi:hypothetical protein